MDGDFVTVKEEEKSNEGMKAGEEKERMGSESPAEKESEPERIFSPRNELNIIILSQVTKVGEG
jgi:hypothetical protein